MHLFFLEADLLHHFFAAHRHTLGHNAQMCGKLLRIALDAAATTDNKDGAYRLAAVQFHKFIRHPLRHLFQAVIQHLQNRCLTDGIGQPHDIIIFHSILRFDTAFDLLCGIEIHQTRLRDSLGQKITGARDHAVGDDTSVFGDTDIRCSGAYIHEADIQHTVHLRDGHGNGRDRLQCHIYDSESRDLHGTIQAVHHIIRQEGGDHIRSDGSCFMILQVTDLITV